MKRFLKKIKGPAYAGLLLACFADAIILGYCLLEMMSARDAKYLDLLVSGTWILAAVAFVAVFFIGTGLIWLFNNQPADGK